MQDAKSLKRILGDPRFGTISETLYKDASSVLQALGRPDELSVDALFAKVPIALKQTTSGAAAAGRGTTCE